MLVLESPDTYTAEEQTKILKQRICPECGAPLDLEGDKLKCQEELACGFFCSVREE